MTWSRRAALVLLGIASAGAGGLPAQAAQSSMVDVGGHKLNVRLAGTAKPGVPTVVFESGLGTPVVAWTALQSEIAGVTKTIAYDRAGIGQSPAGPAPVCSG